MTGETIQLNALVENDDDVPGNACLLCHDTTPKPLDGHLGADDDVYYNSSNSICDDIFGLYHSIVDELDLGKQNHMYQSWTSVFAFANPLYSPLV